MPPLSSLSVRFRLSAAIAVLFGLILLVSLIGMRVLNRTEIWMNVLHQETLAEVSDALDLSRHAADLATSAPFLHALFPTFQLEQEAEKVRGSLARIEAHATGDPALELPLARLQLAIDDLTAALVPQTARKAGLTAIDRDMQRLNGRVRRQSGDTSLPLAEREIWAELQQLTASAIAAGRAAALIELGEFTRRYTAIRDRLEPRLLPAHRSTYREIQASLSRSDGLFVLKHRELAAQLDAGNALFRIRQEVGRVTTYAGEKVAQAEARLSQARAETSYNLGIAKNSFLAFTLMSLLVAVTSAFYVSRYVTRNLRRVAFAMRRLAAGDHRSDLPRARISDDEIGQLFAAFQVFRDNARKLDRRTGEIRRQNALFSRVFRNIKDGVAITAADGQIEAENGTLRTLLRLAPEDNEPRMDMQALIARSAFVRQASAGERGGFEEYTDTSGHVLELRHSPLPDGGAVWLLSETTERKRIDERLEEIRRVETLGKVTGEVAHDFGNILSSISGNLHLLEEADKEKSRHFRARIRSAVDLGVSLTERLLAFARKQHLEPQVTDIGLLVEGMTDLLEIALPDTVSLEFTPSDAPVFARVDPGQLESAVLNLCVNAGQAITGSGTIYVTVGTGNGGGAQLSIRDSGCGMPPDVLRRAAEPFFTHRNDGNGTGLGLSMVDGFVHQSGGHLTITSRTEPPLQGTTVTMKFPALAKEDNHARQAHAAGTALVVDDDPANLAATSNALERLGYAVFAAASFTEGTTQIQQQCKLNLVISDLNLDDGASGWEVLRLAHNLHPECRLVLMSTREATRIPNALNGASRLATLTKPVTEIMMRDLLASR
ncbi:ATPase [Leisingera methylohalidivorans DSM 14336]|uniref:histidine kinase n=1 Tax=Leisingera methylohalidivorans DSM 14336 TaxID=999552 RepID=V9VWL0_9RHOB|nr:ATP-binding protein [Leisingera methylohalidivorans]AHD02109.1 ATPase [Leisingera methylohalidivorans DSM 14336]